MAAWDEPGIVAELGEDAGGPVGELVELADVALARVDAEEAALDQRMELEPDVAGRRRATHDVLEQLAGTGEPAGVLQRGSELEQPLERDALASAPAAPPPARAG